MPASSGTQRSLLQWYTGSARDLPWRRPDAGPWAVLVSEVMLQQTPVARVLPVYDAWLRRWPDPAALAAERAGEAVRMWGRLGYPRRALRLHAAADEITTRYGGRVPDDYDALRALAGVGDYTAAAVCSFAFGQRRPVLDTNVRRVLARLLGGSARPPRTLSRAERARAVAALPADPALSARWNVAVMELGALVCTAAAPRCTTCPVADACAWRQSGHPASTEPRARAQSYAGTDRECRGRLLDVLRSADRPVPAPEVAAVWDDPDQRRRALDSLLDDGLVVRAEDGALALP